MKRRMWLTSGAIVALLSVAALRAAEPNADKPPEFKGLEYSQTGGFAGVQNTLQINAEGKVTLRQGPGPKEIKLPDGKGQLSQEDLEKLEKAVQAVDWTDVKPVYQPKRPIADGFQYSLTVTLDDKSHRVILHDPIDQSAPKTLLGLIKHLNELKRNAKQ